MRTYAQETKATRQTTSADAATPVRARSILRSGRSFRDRVQDPPSEDDARFLSMGGYGHSLSRISIYPPADRGVETGRSPRQVTRTPDTKAGHVCSCGGTCPSCRAARQAALASNASGVPKRDVDGPPVLRDEDQDPPAGGGASGGQSQTPPAQQQQVAPAIPTGVELAGNDHRSYSTLPPASRALYRTYIQNQTLMRLLPAGNYRHGCAKEFLTTASTTCPTTGIWAQRNPCTKDKCLAPGQYGRLGSQTDGPDTFFDNHRTKDAASILEGTGMNECSEVCHQRYKFRAASDRSTYHDLGSFYIIRNFRADTGTDDQGGQIHVTTGSINKVPAQRNAPSQEEFARTIAPELARSGTLAVPPPSPRAQNPEAPEREAPE